MIDFANTVWNPNRLTPVVLHKINFQILLEKLPVGGYITVTTGCDGDLMTDADCITLVNKIKPKYFVTSEFDGALFDFCRRIGVEPMCIQTELLGAEPASVEPEPICVSSNKLPEKVVSSNVKEFFKGKKS